MLWSHAMKNRHRDGTGKPRRHGQTKDPRKPPTETAGNPQWIARKLRRGKPARRSLKNIPAPRYAVKRASRRLPVKMMYFPKITHFPHSLHADDPTPPP